MHYRRILFCIVVVFAIKLVSEPEDFSTKRDVLDIFEEACVTVLPAQALSKPEAHCLPTEGQKREFLQIPDRIVNWGSVFANSSPWRFMDSSCNDFYAQLFERIAKILPFIKLSPHDLFHAHVLTYEGAKNTKEIALVFHAKEYPVDLEKAKNNYQREEEKFTSKDDSFLHRNFVYLSENKDAHPEIYEISRKGTCAAYFPEGANYFSEELLAKNMKNSSYIGDINMFLTKNISRIKYNFYPGFAMNLAFYLDLEGLETNKSLEDRFIANSEIDFFIANKAHDKIIYFMTKF
jgi:hypothetical protein